MKSIQNLVNASTRPTYPRGSGYAWIPSPLNYDAGDSAVAEYPLNPKGLQRAIARADHMGYGGVALIVNGKIERYVD